MSAALEESCTWTSPNMGVAVSQDEYGDVGAYFSTKADLQHQWGVQYVLRVWPMGEEFFWHCKKVRLVCAAAVSHAAELMPDECHRCGPACGDIQDS